jgi:hypothetical protein
MINRANVAMWGNARKSAGPQNGQEKKGSPEIIAGNYTQIRRHGSDFFYIKNSARPRSGFYLHKRFARPRPEIHLHKLSGRFCCEIINRAAIR